jgi:hypothetical protein
MIGIIAVYALFWTVVVMKVNPFKPVPVEDILEEEFRKNEMAEAETRYSELP